MDNFDTLFVTVLLLSNSIKGCPYCEGPKWGFSIDFDVAFTTSQHGTSALTYRVDL